MLKEKDKKSYKSAIDLMSSNTGNLDTISNQLMNLEKSINSTSLSRAVTASQSIMQSVGHLKDHLPNLESISNVSGILSNSRIATSAISGLANLNTIKSLVSSMRPLTGAWLKSGISPSVLNVSKINILSAKTTKLMVNQSEKLSSFVLGTNIAKNTEMALHAENSISKFNWNNAGSLLSIKAKDINPIKTSLQSLSESYAKLYSTYHKTPNLYVEIGAPLSNTITQEFFTAANLIETLSIPEEKFSKEEAIKSDINYENEIKLSEYLPKINKGLFDMWRGAVESILGDNPDRIRHFTVSIRELFTQLLHTFAPDKKINEWTTNSTYYHNGNPTRRARLKYICRNVSSKPLNQYINKDIDATLTFMDLFQKGIHSINNKLSDDQIKALKSKAETTIKFLLEIEFNIN